MGQSVSPRRVVIVGAGLLGLATGRLLADSGHEVTVLDKEDRVAAHQSGHNSGVVHSGIYYAPGSLKATLCRRGVGLLREFCHEHGVAYREIGKVVVARDEPEVGRLREIERRAQANGVPGVRWLDSRELRELEPNVAGVAALHSPTTAIVDYPAVARALANEIRSDGGSVVLGSEVTSMTPNPSGRMFVSAGAWHYSCDHVVICAGLQSDVVAEMAGDTAGPAIIPFRGEYYRLRPGREGVVSGLVYPVPDPAYPFLGVHVTPRVDGHVDIGPNAVPALAREGYRRDAVSARHIRRVVAWPGARRLFRQHWRAGVREMLGSASRRVFVARARDYVPGLRAEDVMPAAAGVRAQAIDADGSMVDDFRIHRLGAVTAVRNAPSPAATACLAIAEHLVDGLPSPLGPQVE